MKTYYTPLIAATVVLAGCSSSDSSPSLSTRLENPLFAERYADEMVDRMVELKIDQDPLLDDEKKADIVEDARTSWLEKARDARQKQRKGREGAFNTIKEYTMGNVLYVDDMLYFDTTFETYPGPDLRVYISEELDPRDVEFPDETAIEIGSLQTPYGAHHYQVPPVDDPAKILTVTLYDPSLGRIYAFAQLQAN